MKLITLSLIIPEDSPNMGDLVNYLAGTVMHAGMVRDAVTSLSMQDYDPEEDAEPEPEPSYSSVL